MGLPLADKEIALIAWLLVNSMEIDDPQNGLVVAANTSAEEYGELTSYEFFVCAQ